MIRYNSIMIKNIKILTVTCSDLTTASQNPDCVVWGGWSGWGPGEL